MKATQTTATSAVHAPTQAKRLKGIHLRYSFRNWSDCFQCPDCGKQRRYSLNFLGQRKAICDGARITAQAAP